MPFNDAVKKELLLIAYYECLSEPDLSYDDLMLELDTGDHDNDA